MKKGICLLMIIYCSLIALHAQDCRLKLQTARDYKDKCDYENAAAWYQKVLNDCGDIDGKVNAELKDCQSRVSQKRASNSRVVVRQQQESDWIIGSLLIFPDEGGVFSEIRITCKDWFSSKPNVVDWLTVSESGSYLVVHCAPNPYPEERICEVGIICDNGTRTGSVTIRQEARKVSSKPSSQTTYSEKNVEDSPIMVKITFEKGKTEPSFESVWNIFKTLGDNNNFGLQIEVPWCKNRYSMRLIEKRVKNITGYFVASGIKRERISQNMTLIDVDEKNTECDCAFAKIVGQAAEGRINAEVSQIKAGEETSMHEKNTITDISDALSSTKILFERDNDAPKIDACYDIINKTVQILNNNPNLKLIVEGYSSDFGLEQHNRDLAQRRANNVRNIFLQRGVNPDQIETACYTINDPQNRQNIDCSEENDVAIFRIVKR